MRFASVLRRDIDAVKNAIELPWSNGQAEGQINRLKMLKRAIYGRAGPELMRARNAAAESQKLRIVVWHLNVRMRPFLSCLAFNWVFLNLCGSLAVRHDAAIGGYANENEMVARPGGKSSGCCAHR